LILGDGCVLTNVGQPHQATRQVVTVLAVLNLFALQKLLSAPTLVASLAASNC